LFRYCKGELLGHDELEPDTVSYTLKLYAFKYSSIGNGEEFGILEIRLL